MDAQEVLRVVDALGAGGVRAGLTGGWGIDALLGRETRPHGDVDLGVDARQLDDAVTILGSLGYEAVQDQRPARVELHATNGQVDLHPIDWRSDGSGLQRGFGDQTFAYPAGSLSARGQIAGRAVACGTAELQVAFHLGYPPTARDRADMSALAEAFGLSLPHPYAEAAPGR